ncbi:hypothetical protein [Enterocloster lavalensis]|uniref:hypothetical protein n=1 Tax=Enterocloster lavalensis TaxID=460384 RepID=UPI00140A8B03|nr:hypothetical protein [Enterocloster lavalensis]
MGKEPWKLVDFQGKVGEKTIDIGGWWEKVTGYALFTAGGIPAAGEKVIKFLEMHIDK